MSSSSHVRTMSVLWRVLEADKWARLSYTMHAPWPAEPVRWPDHKLPRPLFRLSTRHLDRADGSRACPVNEYIALAVQ